MFSVETEWSVFRNGEVPHEWMHFESSNFFVDMIFRTFIGVTKMAQQVRALAAKGTCC